MKIYIPMKMNNSRINWHAIGILYYYFSIDKTKYLRPCKGCNEVIFEYQKKEME